MQPPPAIVTLRFELVILEVEALRALIAGHTAHAGQLLQAVFPDSWPDDEERREGLPWHLGHLEREPHHAGWRVRAVIEQRSRAVVGSVGLKGPPHDGDVEIGWGIDEPHRRLGYGFEAAAGLAAWALARPDVHRISATIDQRNLASQALATKLGMGRTRFLRRALPVWSTAE